MNEKQIKLLNQNGYLITEYFDSYIVTPNVEKVYALLDYNDTLGLYLRMKCNNIQLNKIDSEIEILNKELKESIELINQFKNMEDKCD